MTAADCLDPKSRDKRIAELRRQLTHVSPCDVARLAAIEQAIEREQVCRTTDLADDGAGPS